MVDERVTDQVYSLDDGRFLPDRYIIGTCPHCGYERANGDQCENGARLPEPRALSTPRPPTRFPGKDKTPFPPSTSRSRSWAPASRGSSSTTSRGSTT